MLRGMRQFMASSCGNRSKLTVNLNLTPNPNLNPNPDPPNGQDEPKRAWNAAVSLQHRSIKFSNGRQNATGCFGNVQTSRQNIAKTFILTHWSVLALASPMSRNVVGCVLSDGIRYSNRITSVCWLPATFIYFRRHACIARYIVNTFAVHVWC